MIPLIHKKDARNRQMMMINEQKKKIAQYTFFLLFYLFKRLLLEIFFSHFTGMTKGVTQLKGLHILATYGSTKRKRCFYFFECKVKRTTDKGKERWCQLLINVGHHLEDTISLLFFFLSVALFLNVKSQNTSIFVYEHLIWGRRYRWNLHLVPRVSLFISKQWWCPSLWSER